MTIRFTRAEYWLLDVANQQSVPIADLINGDAAAGLNRSDHECTMEELAEGLERLFMDRFIICYKHGGKRQRLTRSEIEVELRRPKLPPPSGNPADCGRRHPEEKYYQFTQKGGAAWEAFARPNWDLFIDGIGSATYSGAKRPRPSSGYAICPSRWKCEKYLALAFHIGHRVDWGSVRWDTVSPWKATYWKTLPTAHRVRYIMMEMNVNMWSHIAIEVFDLARGWYSWRS